eukprot:11226658-Lingulodinium_polyedra.AAC.1
MVAVPHRICGVFLFEALGQKHFLCNIGIGEVATIQFAAPKLGFSESGWGFIADESSQGPQSV